MAIEPKIVLKKQEYHGRTIPANIGSNYALIGACNSPITDLTVCTSITEAINKFGRMETENQFKGTDAIPELFYGVSTLNVINTATFDGGPQTTLTDEKLTAALNKLHHIPFDTLFIAEELSDAQQEIVTAWLDAEAEAKFVHGQIAQVTKQNAEAYESLVAKYHDQIYYPNTQTFVINGDTKSLNRSTAWFAGFIASLTVDTSLTYMTIPGVSAVTPEYSTAVGEMGATLLSLNIPFMKRRGSEFYVVNSMLPNGFDIYINRTRDKILNSIEAEVVLGAKNNNTTNNAIINLMEGLKNRFINDMHAVEDIKYHIEEGESTDKMKLIIESMTFADIITEVDIYYTISIE